MLRLRDLGWVIQQSEVAKCSQIAQLIEAQNSNILSK